MSIPEFNDLFNDSGSQGKLDFLLSKLEANDLSADEALAILSAVHEELGQGLITDPKVYQSYTNFMKLLKQEKPDVYDYVVSTWSRRNERDSSEEGIQNSNGGESVISVLKSQSAEAKLEKGFDEVKIAEGETTEEGEPLESGEIEEKNTSEVEKVDYGGKESNREETEEVTEEAEGEQKEDKGEESEESIDDKADDLVNEPETDAPQEEGKEQAESEPESDEKESGPDDEGEPNEIPDESTNGSEKGELEGEPGVEKGESEWPDIEESPHEEPFDGLEGEDNPPPAAD